MPITGVIIEEIEIPEKVSVEIKDNEITVSGPKGKLIRGFRHKKINIKKEKQKIIVSCPLPRKKDKAMVGTIRAHINNMIKGVTNGFEYKMKIVYSHFPIKVSVKKDSFVIENFLGEKHPRTAKIIGDTEITIKGDEIALTNIDKEAVGQTAANIERETMIKGYDPRVFQDGIYITQKGG